MTLTYRSEYGMLPEADRPPPVLLLQEWLARHRDAIPRALAARRRVSACCRIARSARSPCPACAIGRRRSRPPGASLRVLPSGCCGMAGTYGHEAEHRATSEQIYGMSWGPQVAEWAGNGRLLATGYSCRSQVKIVDGQVLPHPAQALLACLRGSWRNMEAARAFLAVVQGSRRWAHKPQPRPRSGDADKGRPSSSMLDAAAQAIEAKMRAWRQDIHRNPELGNQDSRTAAIVAQHLRALGYDVRERVAVTGIVAVLRGGGGPGPVVALRADMDALPVEDPEGLPFISQARATWDAWIGRAGAVAIPRHRSLAGASNGRCATPVRSEPATFTSFNS